jgi:hypothetical protein
MGPFVYLCNEALNNNSILDVESLVSEGFPRANIQELMGKGEKLHLWNSRGELLQDGLQACEDGLVHVPENGKIRLWVFEHPIAGLIPIHATDNNEVPVSGDVNNRDSSLILKKIHNDGRFKTLLKTKSIDPKWFEFVADYQNRNWNSYDELRTEATLSWNWKLHQGEFILDPHFSLGGDIRGLEGNYDQDEKIFVWKMQKFGPFALLYHDQSINPEQKFREWLSTGEYAGSSWDIEHTGMRRPYNLLTEEEKRRQTMNSIKLSDENIKEWDLITIKDVPLVAANDSDGVEWAHHLLKALTPGYTSTKLTEDLLEDILETPPFSTVDGVKVSKRVKIDLENQKGDPRMQKLLLAGDDLDSSFIILDEGFVRRNENTVQHLPGSKTDYSDLLINMAANMKGKVKDVLIVDSHAYSREGIPSLKAFKKEMIEQLNCSTLEIMTQHWSRHVDPSERPNNRQKLLDKLGGVCTRVGFTDDTESDSYPHHRYVRIRTDKEDRWWIFGDTLLGRFRRSKIGQIIEHPSVAEESMIEPLNRFDNGYKGE